MKNNNILRKFVVALLGIITLSSTIIATQIDQQVSASSVKYQISKSGYVYKNAHIKDIKSHSSKNYFGANKLIVKKTIILKSHGKKLVYKYVVASNGRSGYVNAGTIKRFVVKKTTVKKTVAKKAVKKTTTKAKSTTKDQYYIPNEANVRAEFKKLLDPYLAQYKKTYGTPSDMSNYNAIVDKGDDGQDYGGEYVVTSGNVVQSDKAMAKELFNGLLHGTLMDNLKDPSLTNVIIDHITFDGKINLTNPGKTPLGIDARLYLTWYWNPNIDSPYVISTHSNSNTNDSDYDE
ncbi:hypothetical protein [Apilactobacillus kunkeei]|uniref:hypothetical protein n=1 Tax=Apilactobacillus kunkeei TaxID=148814 RepID=UPI001C6FB30D|nr:hypothetical protein [Apilactobacillus kunkeei]MBX8456250.1 hypothetical protein [Apilactobacillus kunkeei]QYU55169.1 hypothetical protein K2W87_07465 [Apilactobacillus kunkeei]